LALGFENRRTLKVFPVVVALPLAHPSWKAVKVLYCCRHNAGTTCVNQCGGWDVFFPLPLLVFLFVAFSVGMIY